MTESGRDTLAHAFWRKSSFSNPSSNNCVEVSTKLPGRVAVRDSKNPQDPGLVFSPAQWRAFIELAGPSGS